jgi:glycine/sarcosine N-methyltransferase
MQFYQSIAEQYDYIFPLDQVLIDFVKASIPLTDGPKRILDVGCGTGSLAVALARDGYHVAGVDLDEAMVRLAAIKGSGLADLSFWQMDMRDLPGSLEPSSFDGVLCFGNTLVHLKGRSDVLSFCRAARSLLKEDGRFLIQILNYDHILGKSLSGLPTIENDQVKFARIYQYPEDGSILFRTILTVKDTSARIENEVRLYPLRKDDLETILMASGFTQIHFYGDFRRGPLMTESLPLVVEAVK